VKQNAETNSKSGVGAVGQAGLAVDLIVGLATMRACQGVGSKAGEPIAPIYY